MTTPPRVCGRLAMNPDYFYGVSPFTDELRGGAILLKPIIGRALALLPAGTLAVWARRSLAPPTVDTDCCPSASIGLVQGIKTLFFLGITSRESISERRRRAIFVAHGMMMDLKRRRCDIVLDLEIRCRSVRSLIFFEGRWLQRFRAYGAAHRAWRDWAAFHEPERHLPLNLPLVGTSRCDVRACLIFRQEDGSTLDGRRCAPSLPLRRLKPA